MTTTPPPPVDTDKIPDTERAPKIVDAARVPSLPWAEEVPTAIQCPHPHTSEVSK